jgi:hypothetical protein
LLGKDFNVNNKKNRVLYEYSLYIHEWREDGNMRLSILITQPEMP